MIQLNKHGLLARFYRFWGERDLPDDFCSFFWGLVGRLLKLVFLTAIALAFVFCLVFIVVRTGQVAWAHKVIAGVVMGVATASALIVWRRRSLPLEVVREVGKVIVVKVDAVKNRYCPRIDWKG